MSENIFEDILNRNSDDIKPAPVLPQGPYLTIVAGLPEMIKSSKKQTPGVRFIHKIVSHLEGVDEEALATIEGGIVGKEIKNELWVTEASANMLKEFLIHCGIDLSGRSMAAALDEVVNKEVIIFIKHEMIGDDPATARTIAKIGRTAPAKE